MKRIIIICEGQTEQAFCERILTPYFNGKGYHIQAPTIKHTRGGIVKWEILKKEITNYLKNDKSAFVTTLIDYYGLYEKYGFPGWNESLKKSDKNERLKILEREMKSDISDENNYRFVPYLQLHEFEALLFNDIDIFYQQIPPNDLIDKDELQKIFKDFDNPEMINDGKGTAPSHRLQRIIFGYNKVVYGNILAEAIGLNRIRSKCPRFNFWLQTLEKL